MAAGSAPAENNLAETAFFIDHESFFDIRWMTPTVEMDPVTGSVHCALTPYWAKRLGKTKMHARQLSKRGGKLFCEDREERVGIGGSAVTYLEGTLHLPGRWNCRSPVNCRIAGRGARDFAVNQQCRLVPS